MVARRDVVSGSLLTGLAALLVPRPAGAMTEQREEAGIAQAIDKLRDVIEQRTNACALGPCNTISAIRQQQKTFLKANRKYPDYIDAGVDAWEAVYDWHVKNQQDIRTTRVPDGRYGLLFMFTTIVLREDQTPNFIGWGYDAR